MSIVDVAAMALIFAGAAYTLYRSLVTEKSGCHGCASAGACGLDKKRGMAGHKDGDCS
jgi:hypothetical protein